MMRETLLTQLERVCWSPSQDRSKLVSTLGLEHGFCGVGVGHPNDLHSVDQIHSSIVFEATKPLELDKKRQGDGLWTESSGVAVGVRTADCLPVLFAAKDSSRVAAAHAGWRGLTAGIIRETFKVFDPKRTIVCIGPAISRERFEVGPEVVDAIFAAPMGLTKDMAGVAVAKGQGDRWHVDLQVAAVLQCLMLGAVPENLEVIQGCTFSEPDRWHSYRREGKVLGSNWSWIRKLARLNADQQ